MNQIAISNTPTIGELPFCKATLHRRRCPCGPYFTQVKGYPTRPKTLGEALRKRRLDLDLRQVDVSTLIGCDEMTVVNWEKGHASPRLNRLPGIIQFLSYNPLSAGSTVAERLVAFQKARGLTQKEFARELGVDPSTLTRWERGEREPKGRHADAINERFPS